MFVILAFYKKKKNSENLCSHKATDFVHKYYESKNSAFQVFPFQLSFLLFKTEKKKIITRILLQAGDRSLVSVVAHEIAHSWTGNLVSIKNFEHFWLNEGFTTFIERKINGRVKGEAYRHFSAIGGLKDLQQSVSVLPIFFAKKT